MQIEHLSNLDFGDDAFTYNVLRFVYKSIRGLTFTAVHTKHYTNAVPTGSSYDAKLILHLPDTEIYITPEWAYWAKSQKVRMEAVWKAKEIFSEITFLQRLKSYDDQFSTKGFFSYGQYQFRKGGDVFKDGALIGNANDAGVSVTLGPFRIFFTKTNKSMLEKLASIVVNYDWSIDVSRDRDCFLHMYRLATEKYWPNEHYRSDLRK